MSPLDLFILATTFLVAGVHFSIGIVGYFNPSAIPKMNKLFGFVQAFIGLYCISEGIFYSGVFTKDTIFVSTTAIAGIGLSISMVWIKSIIHPQNQNHLN